MKKFWIIAVSVSVMACSQKAEEKGDVIVSEEQEKSAVEGSYGAALTSGEEVAFEDLLATLGTDDKFEGKIRVKIDDVCQNKGCWMTTELPDGREMRITFKDYGFFVPKESGGYTAVIEGEAKRKVTDEATLKHYAEESGKSVEEIAKIDGPSEELSFVATGVVIEPN